MGRVILHADMNHCYAAIECLYNPDIRNKPVAVAGNPEARHGIILTKNPIAKKFGIQTGEVIWQAKQKCPDLVCVRPDYSLYQRYSQSFRQLLGEYSDKVEAYGLDENWCDVTNGTRMGMDEGTRIANEIRKRTYEELGVTISVGVSFNKVFAKLGSDMKKPDATTTISEEDYKEKVWRLPVSELLFVGKSTSAKLFRVGIYTIGDLAQAPPSTLKSLIGLNGLTAQVHALGRDPSTVKNTEATMPIKSIGNSTTAPHDIENMDDARCIFYMLAESVATRLRECGYRSKCVSIGVRNTKLETASCQKTILLPTSLTGEIARTAMSLFEGRFAKGFPYRSVGLSCSTLVPDSAPEQLDLFGDYERREKELELEYLLDGLRMRFGQKSVVRAVTLMDKSFAHLNPKQEHLIHPMPFYVG